MEDFKFTEEQKKIVENVILLFCWFMFSILSTPVAAHALAIFFIGIVIYICVSKFIRSFDDSW